MNLKEIARETGVSQTTVSMVLHDRAGIGHETKMRVRAALEANGYVVKADSPVTSSKYPRALFIKYKRTSIMVDGNPEYTAKLMDEVSRCCSENGYELVFQVATADTLPEVFQRANREQFMGVILLGTEFTDEDRPLLKQIRKPIVIIDNDLVKLPITSVCTHTWNSMRRKVDYLVSRGHTRIGYLRNLRETSICQQCFRGYQAAMAEHGLQVRDEDVFFVEPSLEGAYESMKKLLARGISLPSALVSNTDCLSLGAMRALQEYGVRIPENVSIIGADNISSCTLYSPQLTTCDVFPKDIGKWAVMLLKDQVENPDVPVIRLRVETRIVERESVCDISEHVPFERTGVETVVG